MKLCTESFSRCGVLLLAASLGALSSFAQATATATNTPAAPTPQESTAAAQKLIQEQSSTIDGQAQRIRDLQRLLSRATS